MAVVGARFRKFVEHTRELVIHAHVDEPPTTVCVVEIKAPAQRKFGPQRKVGPAHQPRTNRLRLKQLESDDVTAAAKQAADVMSKIKQPTDPAAEPWPPMKAGRGL